MALFLMRFVRALEILQYPDQRIHYASKMVGRARPRWRHASAVMNSYGVR